jgi:SsrA-binding protein
VKIVATNRRARHDFLILETYEAGLELKGSEVKSLRAGTVSLRGSYAKVENGQVYVHDFHITPYEKASTFVPDPSRTKRLLLNVSEIRKLYTKTQERGFTLIPLSVYFNNKGYAKMELGLCRGKKIYEKKDAIKERDIEREKQAELKGRQR